MRTILNAAIGLVALCSPASAALIDKGDYALDPVTGLEWLNPSLTVSGDADWLAAGWRLATTDEFSTLPRQYDGVVNFAAPLIAVLGGPTSTFTTGEYRGETLAGYLSDGNEGYFTEYSTPVSMSEWDYGAIADLGLIDPAGNFLVRSDVPETPSYLMMIMGFVTLGYAALRRGVA